MRIDEILKRKRTLSFEVFPPKRTDGERDKLYAAIDRLKTLKPDFVSVTFGAGGSGARNTVEIAEHILSEGIEPLAHITGGPMTPEGVDEVASQLKTAGVGNVLALRGDRPVDFDGEYCKYFPHATDLMERLKKFGFTMGAACYPEGHSESETLYEDLKNLKKKQDAGAKFLITQIFYDNSYYYRLVSEAARAGINVPIIPGVMPAISARNLGRIRAMCGSTIPMDLRNMLEVYRFGEAAMREAGLAYATYQIADLIAKGAPGIHIYIMNKAETALEICGRLSGVLDEYFKSI